MRALDLTPLLRSTIGFDHFSRLLDAAAGLSEGDLAYPPYDIEKRGEDHYRITMAVAGFRPEDLDVTVRESTLVVAGRGRPREEEVSYLHRGIAGRAFERRFELADSIRVVGASLEHGLLHIDLVRELPEEKRPRRIEIVTAEGRPTIEHKGDKAPDRKAA